MVAGLLPVLLLPLEASSQENQRSSRIWHLLNRHDHSSNDQPLIQDYVVGETYAEYRIAQGWRSDTLTGGGKTIYRNPYDTWGQTGKSYFQRGHYQWFYVDNGRPYTGYFRQRKEVANGRLQTEMTGWMVDGMFQGRVRIYHTDDWNTSFWRGRGGLQAKGTVINGEMVGDWILFRGGKPYTRFLYAEGKMWPEEIVIYHPNGQDTASIRVFADDYVESWSKEYDESGNLIRERILLETSRLGSSPSDVQNLYELREYYPEGQLKLLGQEEIRSMILSQTGTWTWYQEDGQVIKEEVFEE